MKDEMKTNPSCDLISRADAIEAMCGDCTIENRESCKRDGYCYEVLNLMALPSAELPKGDLISRRWLLDLYGDYIGDNGDPKYHVPLEVVRQNIIDAPSAEANSDDLIIKGAKGIQDGLYNIKDGKLFQYKAKGGTVRTYEIVPSADAVQGEWIEREDWNGDYYYDCSVCGESFVLCDGTPSMNLYHFCPNCGERMKKGE